MNLKSAIIIAAAVLLAAGGVIVQKEIHKAEVVRAEIQRSERAKLKQVIIAARDVCAKVSKEVTPNNWSGPVDAFRSASLGQIQGMDDWMNANQKDPCAAQVRQVRDKLEEIRRNLVNADPMEHSLMLPKITGELDQKMENLQAQL